MLKSVPMVPGHDRLITNTHIATCNIIVAGKSPGSYHETTKKVCLPSYR